MAEEYKCELCHRTFAKTWSDEEAAAEYHERFGHAQPADAAVVCDDCYHWVRNPKNRGKDLPWRAERIDELVRIYGLPREQLGDVAVLARYDELCAMHGWKIARQMVFGISPEAMP